MGKSGMPIVSASGIGPRGQMLSRLFRMEGPRASSAMRNDIPAMWHPSNKMKRSV